MPVTKVAQRLRFGAIIIAAALQCFAAAALACPFCTAPGPTWAEQRETAQVAILGEILTTDERSCTVRVHHVIKGAERLGQRRTVVVPTIATARAGSLWLLFDEPADASSTPTGEREKPVGDWPGSTTRLTSVAVDERTAAYFLHAPPLRMPQVEQLKYYVRFLEDESAAVADDVYRQFGRASFDDVARVADLLPIPLLRRWLVDAAVPQERQGFYAMALGLARSDDDRAENQRLLSSIIERRSSDFRAGFDGVLAGYLLLADAAGLERLAVRYVADRSAPRGDVLHFLTALCFYAQYGRQIPRERLAAAVTPLVERTEYAAAVIADLARWQSWGAEPRVAAWLATADKVDSDVERAAVAYLLSCPERPARDALIAWRQRDPEHAATLERAARWLLGQGARDR